MAKTNKTIIAIIASVSVFLSATNSLAYDDKTTHPALTDEIVDFYNLSGGTLSPQEKEWIVEGSTLEDTPPRWINHFYDPIHNRGWTGDKAGKVPQIAVEILSRFGLSSEPPLSAVDWVENYAVQESYASYGGNRTWKRGIEYYSDGKKEEAYRTLGHILHLLEDMTVPDHTRDDTHAHPLESVTGDPGSPYELWAEKWTRASIKSEKIASSLAASGASPEQRASIRDYLTAVATYSNKYFFSKDTINDSKYEFPKIVRDDDNVGYGVDDEGREFPLVKVDITKKENGEIIKLYSLKNVEKQYPILSAYFSRLSRRAVLEGAGVIRLFKKKTDESLVNKEFPQHLVQIDPNVRRAFAFPNISLFGIIGKLVTGADRMINKLTHTIGSSLFFSSKKGGAALLVATVSQVPSTDSTGVSSEPQPNSSPRAETPVSSPTAPEVISPSIVGPSKTNVELSAVVTTKDVPVAPLVMSGVEPPLPSQEFVVKNITNLDSSPAPVLNPTPNAGDSTRLVLNSGGSTPLTTGGSASVVIQPGPQQGGVSETPAPVAQTPSTSSGQATTTSSSQSSSTALSTTATSAATSTSVTSATTTTATATIVLPSIQNFQAKFSTSTLAIDFSWTALAGATAKTTYVVNDTDASSTAAQTSSTSASFSPTDFSRNYHFSIQAFDKGVSTSSSLGVATSSVATTTAVVADYFLNVQSVNANESHGSWYSDNWYRLGTGFYGTIYALTLEGSVDGSDFSTSHLTLKEFTDSNYSRLNQSFTISDNAPFTATTAKITIKNLNITLQSNKFYRLDTKQDHQNLSVIVKGTNATGTAMWNEFVSGTGGVTHIYSFYPYVQMIMAKNYPPLASPTAPANPSSTFNAFDLVLNVSWASSTDPDTNDSLLSYQLNYATSSELSSSGWATKTSPASINVVYPNSYTVGVRAVDDFNNTSATATITWSFPSGFVALPRQTIHNFRLPGGKQKIVINSTTTINAVAMWLGGTGGTYCCSQSYMRIFTDAGSLIAASEDFSLADGEIRELFYTPFNSDVTLGPGSYWLVPTKGYAGATNPQTNGTWVFGSESSTYADGYWRDASGNDTGGDAYFRLRAAP